MPGTNPERCIKRKLCQVWLSFYGCIANRETHFSELEQKQHVDHVILLQRLLALSLNKSLLTAVLQLCVFVGKYLQIEDVFPENFAAITEIDCRFEKRPNNVKVFSRWLLNSIIKSCYGSCLEVCESTNSTNLQQVALKTWLIKSGLHEQLDFAPSLISI